ncbi:MAG: P-loop NTPase fold protein [Algibacter sp.]
MKKIESIFEDYLNKEKTNYALLISGKWGSGKTYLWKNVLDKKATEKDFKPVYVSLNGINNSV